MTIRHFPSRDAEFLWPQFPQKEDLILMPALEYARQNDLTVIAICPFVQEYVGSHPEYQSFVTSSVA